MALNTIQDIERAMQRWTGSSCRNSIPGLISTRRSPFIRVWKPICPPAALTVPLAAHWRTSRTAAFDRSRGLGVEKLL